MVTGTTRAPGTQPAGPLLFARYAYPPNERGLCGPDDHRALLEYGAGGVIDDGLRQLAQAFAGAWPYLDLISESTGAGDPLDRAIVEAYWIGNDLLTEVSTFDLGRSLEDRFRRRAGRQWEVLNDAVATGCANHCFHVLSVTPWVGLMRAGLVDDAVEIVDECRISWGTVIETDGTTLIVDRPSLQWTPRGLAMGPPTTTTARALVPAVVDDVVALHWGWACEVLTQVQLSWLRRVTAEQLQFAVAAR